MSSGLNDSNSAEELARIDALIDRLCEGEEVSPTALNLEGESKAKELQDLLPVMKLLAKVRNQAEPGSTFETGNTAEENAAVPPLKLDGVQLDDFQILREVGRGGMGFVFEAIQVSLKRRVALKVIPAASSSLDPNALERFEREGQAAAKLEHPTIARVYARGEVDGVYFLAMQFIDGDNLAEVICQQRAAASQRVPPAQTKDRYREVARIGKQVANALQYAHENGVIHRDVKPSNLLMNNERGVFVADFGLASLDSANQVTQTGNVLGTLRYSSPEQVSASAQVDERTDVYSLGATLYELATLKPAIDGSDAGSIIKAKLDDEPPRMTSLSPDIPADLESIILKAMAKSPAHRYQTALELAVDLQRFLRDEPVHARQPSVINRGVRWLRRNWAFSILASTIILLLLFVVIQLLQHSQQQDRILTELTSTNKALGEALESESQLLSEVEAKERLLRKVYYDTDLGNMFRLASAGNFQLVKKKLEQHNATAIATDSQGFAWKFLQASCNESVAELTGHRGDVVSMSLAKSRKVLATGDRLGVIHIWNSDDWSQERKLTFPGEVLDIEFSPDESVMVACGSGGRFMVWNTADWKLTNAMWGHRMSVTAINFTPDGKSLISASRDDRLAFWDTKSWAERERFVAQKTVLHSSLSLDGKWIVSGGDDGGVKVWETETRELIHQFQHSKTAVLATAFSHDSKLVAAGGYHSTVKIWDRVTGDLVAELRTGSETQSLAFESSRRTLLAGNNHGEVKVYNFSLPENPRHIRTLKLHESRVHCLQLDETSTLITASADRTIRVTRGPMGELRDRHDVAGSRSVKFVDDQRYYLSHHDGSFSLMDRRGNVLRKYQTPLPISPRFSQRNGELQAVSAQDNNIHFVRVNAAGDAIPTTIQCDFAVAPSTIELSPQLLFVADTHSNCQIRALREDLPVVHEFKGPNELTRVAISPNEELVALATDHGKVEIRSLKSGNKYVLPSPLVSGIYAIAFSPDSTRVAAVGYEGRVLMWDLPSRTIEHELIVGSWAGEVAFSPSGECLAVAADEVYLLHVRTRQLITQFAPASPHDDSYEGVAFSPADDCFVAVADNPSGSSLSIWDTTKFDRNINSAEVGQPFPDGD